MRLINVQTLDLVEFVEPDIPNYAILSHTWSSDEVSLHDFVTKASQQSQGYQKVASFCAVCLQLGLAWAWVDTCCIDKSNGAELSEAINSMFRFYKNSNTCIAYLSDVPAPQNTPWDRDDNHTFQKSKWFTRGWTLQELLAPKRVVFYSSEWKSIGEKSSLTEVIATASGIDENYIRTPKNVGLACVAQKMSWVSRRQTTREEDMAYCLLGLFRVNMPLLYGERGRAFLRLQEEILKVSADHTIFAW
ncbi:heterokaryon incompatibility protein-domain-containing protein, partial [Pyrenochaeta sp. MPI-SDFR-AT-0127]